MDEEEILTIYRKGIEAYRRGDLLCACDLLMQVVDANEQDHRAWNALGVVLTKTEKFEDADVCFENALSIDPSNEVYKRNQEKNKRHIKRGISDFLSKDRYPLPLPVKQLYIVAGIVGVIIILIILFALMPLLFPAPISSKAGEIPVLIELDDDLVLIRNVGGAGSDQVNYFSLTGNNKTISSTDGTIRILGTDIGSTLAIPIEELRAVSYNDSVTIRVTAFFSDNTNRMVKSELLSLPTPAEAAIEVAPTPVEYTPVHKKGDVLLNKETGLYSFISGSLPDNQYEIRTINRRNDGLFIIQQEIRNVSMMDYDASVTEAGLVLPGNNFNPGIPLQARRSTNITTRGTYPLYVAGDIISSSSGSVNEAVVILGYDSGTDEYATDRLFRYNNGEWGYRPDTVSEWKPRVEIEQRYQSRINRIALSRIGIGPDSSPPGTLPMYREGDIIAKDRGANSDQLLILTYNRNTSQYDTDTIYSSYGGHWERSGVNTSIIRSVLEQKYPYKVRNVDISLVTVNKQ